METRDTRLNRPKRPTSLSLESIYYPDLDPRGHPGRPKADIRRTQSYHNQREIYSEVPGVPRTTETEYEPRDISNISPSLSPVRTVDVSVATKGGKIAPDREQRRPVVEIRYSTIDHSYNKGNKKEVSCTDTSLSRNSKPKPPTYEDFTLNRSISRDPTQNDYSYGSKTVNKPTSKDFSLNKNQEPKLPTNINFKLASDREKPVTRYDYRYNWQPTKPPSRYNYSYYRGYKLPVTSYDYCYNTDYDVINSPTTIDHSYDQSMERKQVTQKSSSLAPVTEQPKIPSNIDHSFAGGKEKKDVLTVNTGGVKKQPTEIDTRAMVSHGQVVNMKQDIEDTINMVKEYMGKIEKIAAEQQEKENKALQQIQINREEEVKKLIEKYGKNSQQPDNISDEKRKEVIQDLIMTYGKQNKYKPPQYLRSDQTVHAQTLHKVIRIRTPTPSIETEVKLKEKEEPFIQPSYRKRPTSLHLILND